MKKQQFIFALIAALIVITNAISQDLVQWRGTERSGIYKEAGLLKEWPASGPTLKWSFDGLGVGFSSVTVADDKIYTTGVKDSTGYLFAFSSDGKLLWKKEYGKDWTNSYPGSRTTPVFYKDNLYMLSGVGNALCINAKTGDVIWNINMVERFGARNITWGFVEAPAIIDNKVFFTPGGKTDVVVALNATTGETMWKSAATSEKSAYCSPLLIEHKGNKILVTSLEGNLVGLDVTNGALLWKVPQQSNYSIHPNTPLYKDGYIYSLTGYKVGGVMLKLSDDGKSVTELWKNTSLDCQMGGAVWIDDKIVASGHQNDRSWQCLDAHTGNVFFKSNAIGKGVVIFADGLYYCYAESGEMGIMELNNDGFKLKSKFRILMGTEQHWAHPVIDKGVLYIRHGNTLMAYVVKK